MEASVQRRTCSLQSQGKLQGSSTDAMVAHLEACDDCRRTVADLSTDNLFGT